MSKHHKGSKRNGRKRTRSEIRHIRRHSWAWDKKIEEDILRLYGPEGLERMRRAKEQK